MPSQRSRKQICIFGDSHIGCLKNALTQKTFSTRRALDFEFWGADGPRFRGLDLVGSTMVPRPEVLETVLMVNGVGKEVLDPADFDAILFMAVRIRTQDFFTPHLHRMQQPDGFLSKAVFRKSCEGWLRKNRYYRAATAMADTATARIFMAPTSFVTDGSEPRLTAQYPDALLATTKQRQMIWSELVDIAAQDGITLMPQPENTVINGCMTRKEFANILTDGAIDPVHRDPEYAAILLGNVVDAFYS